MGVDVEGSIVFGWLTDYDTLKEYCDKMAAPEKKPSKKAREESMDVCESIQPFLPAGMTCERRRHFCSAEEWEECEYYLVLKVVQCTTLANLDDIDPEIRGHACQFMAKKFDESKEPLYIATVHHM